MNPNSMFFSEKERKRAGNSRARLLDIESDIAPLVAYLETLGLTKEDVGAIVQGHPAVLCYDAEAQVRPVVEYLGEIGIVDVARVIRGRPSVLALDVEDNLKRIVGWLRDNDYTDEQIAEYIATSL